ncbi:RNA polymerase sigma factor [Mucilaginibacter sp. UYCu711]|uniref:RNA polymerase sigma factor n=1 Tax=Mucilaginibacter sp. UYCu711 TaxID=3156339 RepID=UPI003D1EA287
MPLFYRYSDAELLKLLQTGDGDAFDKLYERHWDKVYSQAFKGLHDADMAKDITQEVFVYLWTNRQSLRIQNLPAYLFSSVRNNVFRQLKQQQLFIPIPDLIETLKCYASAADARLLHDELLHAYSRLVKSLPPAQQTIFKMRYQEDLSTSEIASHLNISRKTVQNQLTRAVALLRASLMAAIAILTIVKK